MIRAGTMSLYNRNNSVNRSRQSGKVEAAVVEIGQTRLPSSQRAFKPKAKTKLSNSINVSVAVSAI